MLVENGTWKKWIEKISEHAKQFDHVDTNFNSYGKIHTNQPSLDISVEFAKSNHTRHQYAFTQSLNSILANMLSP